MTLTESSISLALLRELLAALPESKEELEALVDKAERALAEMERRLNELQEFVETRIDSELEAERKELQALIDQGRAAIDTMRAFQSRISFTDEVIEDVEERLNRTERRLGDLGDALASAASSDDVNEVRAEARAGDSALRSNVNDRVDRLQAAVREDLDRMREQLKSATEDLRRSVGNVARSASGAGRTKVYKGGAAVGERHGINFIAGTNVTLTVAESPQNDRTDVTIAASGGAGGSAHTIRENGTDLTARTGLNFTTGIVATDDALGDETEVAIDTAVVYTVGGTDVAVADGGTGASTAAAARTNLGLGTIATQAANNVAITGGSVTGITDLAVADGGTGASDAATARTNLGAAADADVVKLTGAQTVAGVKTFSADPIIPDEAYGIAWNGSLEPPTKNAVYDKIETLSGVTNLGYTAAAGNGVVTSDTGTDATVPAADATNAGLFLPAEKSKLAGIEAGATADQTAAEILTALLTVDGAGSGLDADLLDGTAPTAFGLSLIDDADAAAGRTTLGAAASANAQGVVIHGATASVARPTGYASIQWIGSVAPTNADTAVDTWIDTT